MAVRCPALPIAFERFVVRATWIIDGLVAMLWLNIDGHGLNYGPCRAAIRGGTMSGTAYRFPAFRSASDVDHRRPCSYALAKY